ncbi:MAG: hypothetical protein ABI671_16030 [Burkholderiales bacterium]
MSSSHEVAGAVAPAAAAKQERVALAVDALVEIGLLMTRQIRDSITAQVPETFRSSAIRTSDLCGLISAVLTDEDEPTENLLRKLYGRGVGGQIGRDRAGAQAAVPSMCAAESAVPFSDSLPEGPRIELACRAARPRSAEELAKLLVTPCISATLALNFIRVVVAAVGEQMDAGEGFEITHRDVRAVMELIRLKADVATGAVREASSLVDAELQAVVH